MTKLQEAYKMTGGVSNTSKMPCYSWGIPTSTCRRAKQLMVDEPNSICGSCYAMKGAYNWANVDKAYRLRYNSWKSLPQQEWVNYMVTILNSQKVSKSGYFRWFDSGDIQSLSMVYQLIQIAERTPHIKHWVATREYKDIDRTMTEYIPDNMVFRLSHTNVDELDEDISKTARRKNVNESVVIKKRYQSNNYDYKFNKLTKKQFTCPAILQDGECLDCRACWNSKVKQVAYVLH